MARLAVALAALLLGALEVWLCWAGSQRRLPPGGLVGIRLPSIRRSDDAWYAAHEAAAAPFGLGGGIACTCGLGVLFIGLDVIGVALGIIAAVAVVVGAAVAVFAATRAAGRV